ncbi:GNAT family N-acetyltransferase [Microlunatus speluncae]|uniref:GNAT family N-acetyltransferase n=1 Tax=Microlunatus speluncae TaxID=2594267 RepID=UPI0012667061|nr:GNAT family N-acetyltransferase [Microlunatus speluncae]
MVRFTTRELSKRTFGDFERFFATVHGCACTLYFFGRHLSPIAGSAKQKAAGLGSTPDRSAKHFPHRDLMRARELAAVKELVDRGDARGILVYADGEPVGWCHFGRVDELPVHSEESDPTKIYARHADTDWVINCFTTRMDFRHQGVAGRALKAAVAVIKKHGGGWIEAVPLAYAHHDPMLGKLRRTYRWRSPQVAEYLRDNWPSKQVPGIGRVSPCQNSPKTMGHIGNLSMFEKAGFEPTQRDDLRSTDSPYHRGDFIVMRLKV